MSELDRAKERKHGNVHVFDRLRSDCFLEEMKIYCIKNWQAESAVCVFACESEGEKLGSIYIFNAVSLIHLTQI